MAVLGLHCSVDFYLIVVNWGYSPLVVYRLLIAEHMISGMWALGVVGWPPVSGLSGCGSWALECRLNSCGSQTLLLRGMWDLPRPGIKPMSPALAGGFFITEPPGKRREDRGVSYQVKGNF